MYRINSILRLALGLGAAFCLSHCKKGTSASSNIDVAFVPENPIIITADTKVRGVDIKGAYFKFNSTVTNSATEKLKIVALELKVYPPGSSTPQVVNFDPGMATSDASSTCSFDSFGTFDPADSKPLRLEDSTQLATCSQVAPPFYVGNITTSPNQGSYRYRVVARPIGYFLDANNQESGRYTKTYTFYTR